MWQRLQGQNQDATKSVKSFKLRWPVRNHVMFWWMLINDHSYLVLSPHPSPRSPALHTTPCSPCLATGPVQLSGVLLVVPTSWMPSGRRACQSGLLPSVGCSKMNLKTSDLKPSSLKTPQAQSPSRSLQISFNGKTIQDQTFKLQATTVSRQRALCNAIPQAPHQCFQKSSSSQSRVLWCSNDAVCSAKCVSVYCNLILALTCPALLCRTRLNFEWLALCYGFKVQCYP
jgi:hypothetical protein